MSSVLFVCTGNICRSPTAEGILRHKLKSLGVLGRFSIDSAATHSYHTGHPPDDRTVAVAREYGVELGDLRARAVMAGDFQDFQTILAMDRNHLRILKTMTPDLYTGELRLFLDYCPGMEGQDVPDPYYGEIRGFHDVYALIERGVDGFLRSLLDS
ncbi:MAG: low molecular weight phosphotyrosine protein phosphatase [Alphaproteobacteria bacterium]|nr:low molecular weight phosphotyrosine protein phosphatase [Alphaproteobacteria bacterium]MBP7759772.1 low molecular weight phosphotyrosine protein phosphatase [Alphaproteobacteria bacterium]MBP7763094.1 low molecular weight phosphotyrosine protein phosphatase [Alphaproteobacteria bacterium]MBP7905777.1 low molecular weight phosphotyrosine protein phosphatase [Alphaproteobacteria bacterium]